MIIPLLPYPTLGKCQMHHLEYQQQSNHMYISELPINPPAVEPPSAAGCCGHILWESRVRRKDSLQVYLRLGIDCGSLSAHASLHLVPVLSGGGINLELPCILINGSRRHRSYHWLFVFWGSKSWDAPYRIYKAVRARDNLYLDYRLQVNYESWMETAGILLREY